MKNRIAVSPFRPLALSLLLSLIAFAIHPHLGWTDLGWLLFSVGAVAYSGGPQIDFVFTGINTKLDLVNNLDTQLAAAGWTAISGAGGTNPIYESATTPQGFKIRVDFDSTGATNCMRLRITNNVGTTSPYFFLLPAAAPYRIIANPYQFFYFRTGTVLSLQRALICGGVQWVPSMLLNELAVSAYLGWIHGPGVTDTAATTLDGTLRARLTPSGSQTGVSNYATIWNGSTWNDQAGTANRFGLLAQIGSPGGATALDNQWADGTFAMYEPILLFSIGSASAALTRVGQIWDAIIDGKSFQSESLREFEGHLWRAITHNNNAVLVSTVTGGTLMHVVT